MKKNKLDKKNLLSSLFSFNKEKHFNNIFDVVCCEEENKVTPFQIMDYIANKEKTWEELNDRERDEFKKVIVMVFNNLSHIEWLVPFLESISNLTLSDSDYYKLFYSIMPKYKYRFKSNKPKNKDVTQCQDEILIKSIMNEYFYTKAKAEEYAEDLDPSEAEYLKKRWIPMLTENCEGLLLS